MSVKHTAVTALVMVTVSLISSCGAIEQHMERQKDARIAADQAEHRYEDQQFRSLRKRYGLTEDDFVHGTAPEIDDTDVAVRRNTKVLMCRTYADPLRIYCPVKSEPRIYEELPRR